MPDMAWNPDTQKHEEKPVLKLAMGTMTWKPTKDIAMDIADNARNAIEFLGLLAYLREADTVTITDGKETWVCTREKKALPRKDNPVEEEKP